MSVATLAAISFSILTTVFATDAADGNGGLSAGGSAPDCYICGLVSENLMSLNGGDTGTACKKSSSEFSHTDCIDNQSQTYCSVEQYPYCNTESEVLADGSFEPRADDVNILVGRDEPSGVITASCGVILARRYSDDRSKEIVTATQHLSF